LQVEERVGAEHRGPIDDLVEGLPVFLGGAAIVAVKNKILIKGEADDVAPPTLGDELNFVAGEGGSGEEALLVGVGVLQAGAVEAAEEDGLAGGGVDDAVAGGTEAGEIVGEAGGQEGTSRDSFLLF